MKKIIIATLALITFTTTTSAAEKPVEAAATSATTATATPAYKKFEKIEFEKMTKAQKLKFINERHERTRKRSAEKWAKLTDDEKITQFETRRARYKETKLKRDKSKATPSATNCPPPVAGSAAPKK